jgi:glycosyltransferase involved in cell wall biosynthesis
VSTDAPRGGGLEKKEKGFTILSAGRFVPLKGFDITIKSFARFYNRLPVVDRAQTKLVLVGDGPYKSYLERLTHELHLDHAVEFIEWLDRDEFKKLYMRSHAFLFPSHEGAGMVVAEALSYGLPVLCFSNDGPGEFVDETCGITVPYGRYDSSISRFADGLDKLYHDKVLYQKLSQGAIRSFEYRFDWNLKGELLRDIYNSVTRNAG